MRRTGLSRGAIHSRSGEQRRLKAANPPNRADALLELQSALGNAAVSRLIDDAQARQNMIREFDLIAAQLGQTGASERAAAAILEEIS